MIKKIKYDELEKMDLLVISVKTIFKLIRGLVVKIFFKKSNGFVFVGKKTSITHMRRISVGKNVKFEDYSEIHGLCKKGLKFGDNVTIGRNTMIRPSSYYGIDIGEGLSIGNNSSIGPLGYIGCAGYIEIGENVMIGPRVSMFAENHNFNNMDVVIKEQGVSNKGIVIEDNCWIGSGVIILDGVIIGAGSIIGAGTIVSKDIPANSIVLDRKEKYFRNRKRD